MIEDRYVISNCGHGKLFFWEIIAEEKPSGKKEVPDGILEDNIYIKTWCHDQAKPYDDFQYDQELDLFVGKLFLG